MRLLFLTAFLFSFGASTVFAQNHDYIISPALDLPSMGGFAYAFDITDEGFQYITYDVTQKNYTFSLVKTDRKFNVLDKKTYNTSYSRSSGAIVRAVGDTYEVFVEEIDMFKGDYTFYKLVLDQNFKKVSEKQLYKASTKRVITQESDNMSIVASNDESQIARLLLSEENKTGNTLIEVVVFDKAFNLVYSKQLKYPVKYNSVKLVSSAVSLKGDLALVFKEYEGKNNKEIKDKKPNYKLQIGIVNDKTQQLALQTIPLEGLFARSTKAIFDNADKLKVFGLATLNIANESDKFFFSTIGNNGEVTSSKITDIPANYIDKINQAKKITNPKKAEDGFDASYDIRYTKVSSDNSIQIYFEDRYQMEEQNVKFNNAPGASPGGMLPMYYFATNFALRVEISTEGNANSFALLPKRTIYRGYSPVSVTTGFGLLKQDDKDYFIYNMERADFNTDVNEINKNLTWVNDHAPAITSMTSEGTLERHSLFYNDKRMPNTDIIPQTVTPFGNGEYMLTILSENKIKMVYLKLK